MLRLRVVIKWFTITALRNTSIITVKPIVTKHNMTNTTYI